MNDEILKETAEVWSPNYPRRCAGLVGPRWGQVTAQGPDELIYNIRNVEGEYPGYVSTYSFPDGHPSDNPDNIPRIDTLMIDFDFDFDKDEFDHDEWERKLGDLLTRLRMVAKSLVESGYDRYWRGSLSGFKGAHLYLDFPPIREGLGTPEQYRNGMNSFTNNVVDGLKEETGISDIEEYIDVTSGWDLSRLTRLPNTIHEKASRQFGEARYCVPVTIREMQHIDTRSYVALCRSRRPVPESCQRFPNLRTGKTAERFITTATKQEKVQRSASVKSAEKYDHYVENVVNEAVELDDVEFLLKRKPCIWAFHENMEKFDHGHASHIMEIQCILAMASIGTPIEVMKEFFKAHPYRDEHPRYDDEETQVRIKEVLSRDYGEFNCSSILEDAPQFCLKQDCRIYQNDDKLQKIH